MKKITYPFTNCNSVRLGPQHCKSQAPFIRVIAVTIRFRSYPCWHLNSAIIASLALSPNYWEPKHIVQQHRGGQPVTFSCSTGALSSKDTTFSARSPLWPHHIQSQFIYAPTRGNCVRSRFIRVPWLVRLASRPLHPHWYQLIGNQNSIIDELERKELLLPLPQKV